MTTTTDTDTESRLRATFAAVEAATALPDRVLVTDLLDRHLPEFPAAATPLGGRPGRRRRGRGLRRHRRLTVAGVVAVVLAGGGTAYAVRHISSTPPASNSLYCYSEVSSDQGDNAPRVGAMVAAGTLPNGTTLGSGLIDDPVRVCGNLYRQGALKLGVARLPGPITLATDDPVPQLTACVRADGTVAVEPGGPAVCAAVGMTLFSHYLPPSR